MSQNELFRRHLDFALPVVGTVTAFRRFLKSNSLLSDPRYRYACDSGRPD